MAEVDTRDRAGLEKVRDVDLRRGGRGRAIRRHRRRRWTAPASRSSRISELSLHDPNSIAIELSEWAAQGDWRLFFLHRDRIEKVTPAGGQGRRRAVPDRQQPHGRLLPAARPSPSGRRSPRRPTSPRLLQATTRAGRSHRRPRARHSTYARGDRGPRAASGADRRRQGRPAAQEEPRPSRRAAADPALRQCREPQGIQGGRPACFPS